MVTQYPHWCIIKDSNWAIGNHSETGLACRYETGAAAKQGFGRDDMTPKGVIYFPLPMRTVEIDTNIEVYYVKDGELKAADIVKQFSLGQLNARLWL